MATEKQLRRIIALIGLSILGCAASPEAWLAHPFTARESVDQGPLPLGCPYADVYVAVGTNDTALNAELAERVQISFANYLAGQGFRIAAASDVAYWSAFSLVSMNRQVTATFAWSVYTMARQDLGGRVQAPFRFAVEGDAQDDLSGFMLLREVHLLDIDSQVRSAAEATANALYPHASRMCVAWTENEELREELAQEMRRIRAQRQQQRNADPGSPRDSVPQQKRLRIESEPPSDS